MRRRYARLLTLVLIAELALLCCACGHAAAHRCGPDCPICDCVRLSRRGALPRLPLLAACGMLISQTHGHISSCVAKSVPSLFERRVRLND